MPRATAQTSKNRENERIRCGGDAGRNERRNNGTRNYFSFPPPLLYPSLHAALSLPLIHSPPFPLPIVLCRIVSEFPLVAAGFFFIGG